ncbi:MAG: DoxX family protein [Gammaproteobacteria bacterium]
MNVPAFIGRPLGLLDQVLDALQPLVALGARCWVSWQFFKSGLLKISDWESTLYLFQEEYRTPLLTPAVAAVAGTFGELFFPILLVAGLFGRFAAVGLLAVNILAVVSYAHVLLTPGFEAAVGQHYLWGALLLMLAVYGPGRLSLDHWSGLRWPGRPS